MVAYSHSRWVLVALVLLHLHPRAALAQDHLEPETGSLYDFDDTLNYVKKLHATLMKDKATYYVARMICLPAFEPQWMVTVVLEDGDDLDDEPTYFVEFAEVSPKLGFRGDGLNVTVKKTRAPLDRETAKTLDKVWHWMLRATRIPEEPRVGADGVDYHFSRFVHFPRSDKERQGPLAGFEQGTIWSPDGFSLCNDMVTIGEALKKYALARPEERDKLRSALRTKTEQFRARLERRHPGLRPRLRAASIRRRWPG